MEEQKKLSFFKKMALAITDFRLYPFILKTEKVSKSFGYFLKLILIVTFIMAICTFSTLLSGIETFMGSYDMMVPEFSFQNGVLNVGEEKNFKLDDDTLAIIDTSMTYEEYKNSEKYNENTRYDTRVFVNSDAITYENYDGSGARLVFQDLGCSLNKKALYSYITILYSSFANKVIMFLAVYVAVFMQYFFVKIFEILVITLMVSVICALFRMRLDVKNYFKIAIYAMTLPYLLEAISVACVGSVKTYTMMVTSALSYVYIFYAIRAVKLDAFLLIMSNANKKNGKVVVTKVDKNGNPIKDETDVNNNDIQPNDEENESQETLNKDGEETVNSENEINNEDNKSNETSENETHNEDTKKDGDETSNKGNEK